MTLWLIKRRIRIDGESEGPLLNQFLEHFVPKKDHIFVDQIVLYLTETNLAM